jgi:TRAP-type C4-dicarboxylate transport system permease small subunit
MKSSLPRNPFTNGLESLIRGVCIAAGWWLIGISVLTCVEMLGRKVFGFSLQGVDEIGSYTFAVVTALGFSYALFTRGHTRVDFLVSRLPPSQRAMLNWFAMVTLGAMAAFFAYRAYFVVAESIDLKSTAPTPLATPLWIPQSVWFAAYVLFALTALSAAVHACALAVRGAWDDLNASYGPQTLEEEIESEAAIHVELHRTDGAKAAP